MDPTILVVDDDPHLREVIADALGDEGYDVRQAADGQRALEKIAEAAPDLVLSDISMPRLTGVELAERLSRRASPVPVVLMSATTIAPPVATEMFLRKPFALDELLGLVASALRKTSHSRRHDVGALQGGR
ncbi:MAG: response regulator [Chloroflexia bacterium]|nr:response regulator [Chloroflexia bacterium]